MRKIISCFLAAMLVLTGCAKQQGQSQYMYNEVGVSKVVDFGTIITARQVDVTGRNTGTGGLIGTGAGAGAASYMGNGSGTLWAVAGGAIAGAVIGSALEQEAANKKGIEYVVTLESGKTLTIVQNINKEDVILQAGERVMVQSTGSYQRVLPADNLPESIKRPKGIKVTD